MTTLQLNRAIYTREAIEQSVSAYESYGRIQVQWDADADYHQVTVESEDPKDEAQLVGHFANHVLVSSIGEIG
jgi:hypothetical protein